MCTGCNQQRSVTDDSVRTRSRSGDSKTTVSEILTQDLCMKLKSPLKGKTFQTVDEVRENMMGQLMVIPTKDFAEYFEQLKRC